MAVRSMRTRNVRLLLVAASIVLAWAGLGYRLVQVQAVNAEHWASSGSDQRLRHESLPAVRGTIYDRDGVELAVTVEAVTVIADPSLVTRPRRTARLVAPVVGVDVAMLTARLSGDGRFAYVARAISDAAAEQLERVIEKHELTGLSFITEPKRTYPAGALASQLVGFVMSDTEQGLEGLELALDDHLTGTDGTQVIERDRYGIPIPQGMYTVEPAVPGADVVLTIDREIQYAAERYLAEALETTGARAGTVIVQHVATGELLAIANSPGFDPNVRLDVSAETVRNRAVADVYEPGSTLKVVTIAAALEEGLVTPATRFDVPAELRIHDKVYTDTGRTRPEEMTVARIVARSSNIGTITVQQILGNSLHYGYLERFGLGASTGSGLPAEAAGQLQPVNQWCSTTCGPSTAIGYRVGVTPLQMAAVFATIANGGVWVQPHIVKEIIPTDGERIVTEPVHRTVISEETARTMQLMLQGVVDSGTGIRAEVDGYTVGGKTGTTEKWMPDEGRYSETDRIASFIGIAPINDPQIVIAVVLDSPHGDVPGSRPDASGEHPRYEFGGVSAAPVFALVAEATLHQLGAPPDGS
ncbi:MAG: peptidoglycan D,D-transpeptidase FtsI family protein [Acidimicrobiia bacterium]